MPELPEVETIVRQLAPTLTGRRFGSVMVSRDDIIHGDRRPLSELLPGRRVRRVYRRAKRIVIELPGEVTLIFHLGMTGRLTLCDDKEPIDKHTHVVIAIEGRRRELRFRDPRRFGGVWCLTGAARYVGKELGPLGPEALELRIKDFKGILARRRQIKALLLDQRMIAGLGNIYCDESLHAANIHPLTAASDLGHEEALRLLRAIKATLRKAIRHKGTTMMDYRTADGEAGAFRRFLRVYHREGEPCKRCGAPIERLMVAGRSSFICPRCQVGK